MSVTTTDDGGATRIEHELECDVVMKGGITSGVIYPGALHRLAETYRLRNIGGASAGAIGAALGAAAEFARTSGGFERLRDLPAELGDDLHGLFQAQDATKPMLALMLAATGNGPRKPGPNAGPADAGPAVKPSAIAKARAIVGAALRGYPLHAILGAVPGGVLLALGIVGGGAAGVAAGISGAVIGVAGGLVAMVFGAYRTLTRQVTANEYGICRGLGRPGGGPGFTDWLADQIDAVAGRDQNGVPPDAPLTFGQLWSGTEEAAVGVPRPKDRRVDLRMITTCLSEGRPYELPWEARQFFFDPEVWKTLFPGRVVTWMLDHPPVTPASETDEERWAADTDAASKHDPPLYRLPAATDLPVIVATRLSLSFPLLISAIPLWTIAHTSPAPGTPGTVQTLRRLVFTDGGFCSNFPIHLFDAPLPTRPTFAINLGRFADDGEKSSDQNKNIVWASNNRPVPAPYSPIPEQGIGALNGFASAAFNTARNWQDSALLGFPGQRDRIVLVKQTQTEGGLNLYMGSGTIADLSGRGCAAANALVEQFTQPHYPEKDPTFTGWDNHRWVRYRALLSVLPDWFESFETGLAVLKLPVDDKTPSYQLDTAAQRALADSIVGQLSDAATSIGHAAPNAVEALRDEPKPRGVMRRVPQT